MLELVQGSPEWLQARCGSLGASMIGDALAKTKSGWGASRANLLARLTVERLTGVPQETFQTQAMLEGIEREPEARAAYEFMTDATVRTVGLVPHPSISGTHASPDGLVNDNGLLEIKCPQPAAHLATLLGEPIPQKYLYQMAWQMACTERLYCDFVSYCPQFPAEMQMHIERVHRRDQPISHIEEEVRTFLSELDAKVEALRSKYLAREAA